MKVSVIATVLNEAAALPRLLDSLAAQSRFPDEVVIVDGGSTDSTLAILQDCEAAGRLPLQTLELPGGNISQGRNAAIAVATGQIIASTDAGVRLDKGWLSALIAPFETADAGPAERRGESDRFVAAVAGWFEPEPQTWFEAALGATVLPQLREIRAERFLPSSRSVAFRRVAWEAARGYPEWLDYCEDLIFDFRLRGLYGPFAFAPEALVHFRPRNNLRAFFRQYYRYARGDGKADLWRRRHAIRYLTYLLVGPALVILALLHSPWWWLALLTGLALYTAIPYRRLFPMLTPYGNIDRLRAIVAVPVIRIAGDIAKMAGYPVGLAWRWKNRHRPEIHWKNRLSEQ